MTDEELQHLQAIRQTHMKRLRKLEQQAATFGNQTPIHILGEGNHLGRKNYAWNGETYEEVP